MKKILFIFINLILVIGLFGCSKANPLVNVMIKDNEDKIHYETVYDNGKTKEIEKIEVTEADIYYIDTLNITHEIVSGKIINNIKDIKITNEEGQIVKDELLNKIVLNTVNSINHDIYYFEINKIDNNYYLFIKLNVNMSDPCYLYEYDINTNQLNELIVWQDVDLIGLQMLGGN